MPASLLACSCTKGDSGDVELMLITVAAEPGDVFGTLIPIHKPLMLMLEKKQERRG